MNDWISAKAKGDDGEIFLDSWLEYRGYQVKHVSNRSQYLGVDRLIGFPVGSSSADVFLGVPIWQSCEYKTDYQADTTGNLFIEMYQILSDNRVVIGWAPKCLAQYLFFYIPGRDMICEIPVSAFKSFLTEWCDTCRFSRAVNACGRQAVGLLVPLTEMPQLGCCYYVDRQTKEAIETMRKQSRVRSACSPVSPKTNSRELESFR